jgi:deazaflavin-dependent oxidoreductase (nitroreductase family)
MKAQPRRDPQDQSSFLLPYPKGFLRFVMRLPIPLYRLHLGWLLGKRFLLLEHLGRRSNEWRRAVIEVVDHDPQEESYVVAAAWGAHSDWFRNIQRTPGVYVTVSTHRFAALAQPISPSEAARHLKAYSVRSPAAFKQIGSRLVGETSGDADQIIQAFVSVIPFVKLTPVRIDGHVPSEGRIGR